MFCLASIRRERGERPPVIPRPSDLSSHRFYNLLEPEMRFLGLEK